MPNGSAFAPIHTQPPPYAMPEVLRDGVVTVLINLPFQSTSHAASSGSGNTGRLYVFALDAVTFCCPIHKPPGASVITASAFGYMPGDLKSFVVFATRGGAAPRPRPPPPCASVMVETTGSARPAARNSLRFMLMASLLSRDDGERSVGVEADVIAHILAHRMTDNPNVVDIIKASQSSSALACDWFDYWRERDFGVLSSAFNVPTPFVTLRLEVHIPTGMRGADANLDVLLTTADGWLFAITSTFTEPYATSTKKSFLKPQYFSHNRSRWSDVGLPGCQAVAEQIRSGHHRYASLDVPQLLKHMLSLGRTGNRWTLCYLWYDVPGPAADAHRAEVTQ